jgi:hypothetical protein
MPRDDETMSPNLGFNSWVTFTSATHEEATVAGEFLLLEDEVNPVLAALPGDRLQVTGLAQSSIRGGPRRYTLDFTGVGEFRQLASEVRRSLNAINKTRRTGALASHSRWLGLSSWSTLEASPR